MAHSSALDYRAYSSSRADRLNAQAMAFATQPQRPALRASSAEHNGTEFVELVEPPPESQCGANSETEPEDWQFQEILRNMSDAVSTGLGATVPHSTNNLAQYGAGQKASPQTLDGLLFERSAQARARNTVQNSLASAQAGTARLQTARKVKSKSTAGGAGWQERTDEVRSRYA